MPFGPPASGHRRNVLASSARRRLQRRSRPTRASRDLDAATPRPAHRGPARPAGRPTSICTALRMAQVDGQRSINERPAAFPNTPSRCGRAYSIRAARRSCLLRSLVRANIAGSRSRAGAPPRVPGLGHARHGRPPQSPVAGQHAADRADRRPLLGKTSDQGLHVAKRSVAPSSRRRRSMHQREGSSIRAVTRYR